MNATIHLRILAGGLGIVLLASCESKVETSRLERNKASAERLIADMESDIATLEEEIAQLETEAAPAEAADNALRRAQESKGEWTTRINELEPRIQRNIVLLNAYKSRFRITNTFKTGEELGDFTLKSGQELKGAVVTQTKGAQVGLRHQGGIGYFTVDQLPEKFKDRIATGPVSPASPVDIDSLFAATPNVLKSSSEISKDRRAEYDALMKKRERDRLADIKERDMAYAAEKKRKDDIQLQITALTQDINQAAKVAANYRNAKRAKEYEWASKNVKPAKAERAKQLAKYDQQIALQESRVAKLRKERDVLFVKLRQ